MLSMMDGSGFSGAVHVASFAEQDLRKLEACQEVWIFMNTPHNSKKRKSKARKSKK